MHPLRQNVFVGETPHPLDHALSESRFTPKISFNPETVKSIMQLLEIEVEIFLVGYPPTRGEHVDRLIIIRTLHTRNELALRA